MSVISIMANQKFLNLKFSRAKAIGRHRAGHHIADHRQARDDEAVEVEGAEAGAQRRSSRGYRNRCSRSTGQMLDEVKISFSGRNDAASSQSSG